MTWQEVLHTKINSTGKLGKCSNCRENHTFCVYRFENNIVKIIEIHKRRERDTFDFYIDYEYKTGIGVSLHIERNTKYFGDRTLRQVVDTVIEELKL